MLVASHTTIQQNKFSYQSLAFFFLGLSLTYKRFICYHIPMDLSYTSKDVQFMNMFFSFNFQPLPKPLMSSTHVTLPRVTNSFPLSILGPHLSSSTHARTPSSTIPSSSSMPLSSRSSTFSTYP